MTIIFAQCIDGFVGLNEYQIGICVNVSYSAHDWRKSSVANDANDVCIPHRAGIWRKTNFDTFLLLRWIE